jgi:Family of unknown function (DUF6459)
MSAPTSHTALLDRAPAAVRLLPVPQTEPPADEEWSDHGWDPPTMTAPTLPLRLHSGGPGGPEPRRRTTSRPLTGAYASSRHGPGAYVTVPTATVPTVTIPTVTVPTVTVRTGDLAGPALELGSAGPVDVGASAGAGASADLAADVGWTSTPGPGAAGASVAQHPVIGRPGSYAEPRRCGVGPPEVRVATMRFLSTFLEVTAGFRPVLHLRQHCRPDRFGQVSDHLRGRPASRNSPAQRGAAALAGRLLIVGRTPAGGPPRVGRASQRAPSDKLSLRTVQICQVSNSVAEVVVVLSRRGASAAMAVRMEKCGERWLCVHLEIV